MSISDAHFIFTIASVVVYPIIFIDLFKLIFTKAKYDKTSIKILLQLIIFPLFMQLSFLFDIKFNILAKIIMFLTPYLLILYLIAFTIMFLKLIITKIKNNKH